MTESVFDRSIAAVYDETRPITAEACQGMVRDALEGVTFRAPPLVADVGCGTGRILEHLVPAIWAPDRVVAIDESTEMLARASQKPNLANVTFVHQSVVDFASSPAARGSFNLVMAHWLFHCVEDWPSAILSCLRILGPNGVLIWFEEDGDLYRALDRLDPLLPSRASQPVYQFFAEFYALVEQEFRLAGRTWSGPSCRLGTPLRNTQNLVCFLASRGWSVTHDKRERSWSMNVTYQWLLSTVLEQRVFTNLRRIPSAIYGVALAKLKQAELVRRHQDIAKPICLNFSGAGNRATRVSDGCRHVGG